jgi:hypothetical protein
MESMEKRAEQSEAVCGRAAMFCISIEKKEKKGYFFSLSGDDMVGTE